MLTTSKTHQNYWPIAVSVVITLLIWLASKWYYWDWFDNPFKYPAKAASLTATVLMCWCIVLSTRLRLLEDFFGGLDKVYQVHKRLGKLAFWTIIWHPLFLAADKLPDAVKFLQLLWFRLPGENRYILGHNVGLAAFLLMAVLTAFTLWLNLPYHRWKRSHEVFGLVHLAVIVHIFTVNKDVAAYPFLGAWLYSLLTLALLAFVYIRFGYRFLGPHYRYTVSHLEKIKDILEVTLAPQGAKMDFRPSQFVYLVVHKKEITPEPHPYSVACGYNLDANLKLGIKQTGDHTRTLDLLAPGDPVTIYGPYGRFSDQFLTAERDCIFVGGGIGITPFLGMWHVALHSEERLDQSEVPEPLQHLHPEIIKTWKSPLVHLFYVSRNRVEASFDDDIRREVEMSHFHGFEAFERRGHSYELYLTSEHGRITADYIDKQVPGGLKNKYIFICGPSTMVCSLLKQFKSLGVGDSQIIVEDFNMEFTTTLSAKRMKKVRTRMRTARP